MSPQHKAQQLRSTPQHVANSKTPRLQQRSINLSPFRGRCCAAAVGDGGYIEEEKAGTNLRALD